ncbi:MAG: 50S ribosomal protein L32e [Methanomicrobiaceae archaeon]|nr:50S ribosomal protein L32e [Methanomicrobiaceae archaeon]
MADENIRLIKARNAQRGSFKRQGLSRKKKLDDTWRRPRGLQSKQRRQKKCKGSHPQPGFGSPRAVRGMHPSGYEEVLVFNVADLEGLDAETQAIRISATVGGRKRVDIQAKADEVPLKILNRKDIASPAEKAEKTEDEVTDDE